MLKKRHLPKSIISLPALQVCENLDKVNATLLEVQDRCGAAYDTKMGLGFAASLLLCELMKTDWPLNGHFRAVLLRAS